ncbi:enhanced adult sensory threshold isoform X2 [Xylocopa sonorina]
MASREKKPLAPSKAKQKANNDCGLPTNEIKSRKGKTLTNLKQQQLARDILEAVATGSQLPPKLEASLPRKKVLRNLKRKQKLRVAKANLIKSKVARKVTNRNLVDRITIDIKRSVRAKRLKLSEENGVKFSDIGSRNLENHINDLEIKSIGAEVGSRSAKNNLRAKKGKVVQKINEEIENEGISNREIDSVTESSSKTSPKLGRKGRSLENSDSLPRGVKSKKFPGIRKSSIREKGICIKTESDIKYTKGRRGARDIEYGNNARISKSFLETKSSIDLTIDEVIIASMLSDSDIGNHQGISEKTEGKVTRSKKMLVNENLVPDIEIKKEPDSEDIKITFDYENPETESVQSVVQRKRSSASINQRSLRKIKANSGKLRQTESGPSADLELKKRRRLNSDEPLSSDVCLDNITDGNADTESCFSESSGNDSQIIVLPARDELWPKQETLKSLEDNSQPGSEVENNNNSDRPDRSSDMGPTLRSKTKAKSTEVEIKNDNIKVEYARIAGKNSDVQDELKKATSLDQVRKDNILAKLSDKTKGRRNSLNIDMKKTVSSFYGTEKSDGNPKSQIDQMIETIKMEIAKSIEDKIYSPEKGLGLNKNFEIPKIEEIIAPLSSESQKLGLEETTDEDKSAITKNEIKSDSSENSVPKVADTAKEIEKLVMGDIELAETHSQNVQESESPDTDTNSNNNHNVSELVHVTENSDSSSCCKPVEQQGELNEIFSVTVKEEEQGERQENIKEEEEEQGEKCTIEKDARKSSRTPDKASSPENGEPIKQLTSIINKTAKKSENSDEEEPSDELAKPAVEETGSNDEPVRNGSIKKTASDSLSGNTVTTTASTPAQEKIVAKVDETTVDEAEVSATATVVSDEAETLESISREVERLVAENRASDQTQSREKETRNDQEGIKKTTIESPARGTFSNELSPAAAAADTVKQEATPVVETKEIEKSDGVAENSKEVVDESAETRVEAEESISDPKRDTSPVAVNNDTCNSLEERRGSTAGSGKDKCKQDDNNDNNNAVDNIIEKKVILSTNSERNESAVTKEETEKSDGNADEQKIIVSDENKKRVLRARDKMKKLERGSSRACSKERNNEGVVKIKTEEEAAAAQKAQNCHNEEKEQEEKPQDQSMNTDDTDDTQNGNELDANDADRQARTRRMREAKKRKEDQLAAARSKRSKRDIRRSDQQNKEETLLDNEVAKINENDRSFLNKYGNRAGCAAHCRGFSEGGRGSLEKRQATGGNARSKSENDLMIGKEPGKAARENRLSRNLSENHMIKQPEGIDMLDADCKPVKTPETSQKDSDETSTSGESSSSVNINPNILETAEDKAKKESILRILGLEPLEKAAERISQKAKKDQSSGTLKTVIRVQKEKEKDKRRSRSPLKMVLKQGRGDGEGDSPENNFYTIQKENGTSGWGDSSSGANRKFSTNHRHSCDEDNEDTTPKDRQSLVIPEKSSSFSIHPGRLCADVCCYCFGKFGSLDTPMHLAQMKSDERRKKILNIERHLTKDSCLCDACYRHVDRKANTSPTNMQAKPQKQHRQLMVSKCSARECRDAARHHVKRRWLLKIKAGLHKQVDIDWESSQHTSMSFCVNHYSKIERFLTCALCTRRLARNHTHQLANAETEELNQLLGQQGVPVVLAAGTFVCKLCRYFTQLQLKYKDVENMNTNHKSFFKNYRKRILHFLDIEVLENEDEDSAQNQSKDKDKDKRKRAKCNATQSKTGTSKSPDVMANSASEKSTPEPTKNDRTNPEADNENRTAKPSSHDENVMMDVQFLGIENAAEKLKKRKLLDTHLSAYAQSDTTLSRDSPNEVVEILAMDKEVTLTILPKRPRTSNDITPVVQRLGANPSISVRTLFPGEEEMNLHANIEFTNVREITPQGWEKCATMIQYDRDTKLLWQELQRPYGNQSSFLRHLILLEKYYRSGDLVLAPNASRNAINYSTSVQNRLISYEGPEKMDEPIMEPIGSDHNKHRVSDGYMREREKHSFPSTSTPKLPSVSGAQAAKGSPPRVLKLNPGVSIIKKPPPNLQRLNLPSSSASNANANVKRKDGQKFLSSSGGKVFQLTEPDFKRLQNLKKQKQQMLTDKQSSGSSCGTTGGSGSPSSLKSTTQYQKAQIAAHTQFQKHLRMQQEMLNRQSRSDFEPLICDVRTLTNENSPTQNLLHNLNLPKSIQVTTNMTSQIPILPKIPKSLTVIPQTITRPADK